MKMSFLILPLLLAACGSRTLSVSYDGNDAGIAVLSDAATVGEGPANASARDTASDQSPSDPQCLSLEIDPTSQMYTRLDGANVPNLGSEYFIWKTTNHPEYRLWLQANHADSAGTLGDPAENPPAVLLGVVGVVEGSGAKVAGRFAIWAPNARTSRIAPSQGSLYLRAEASRHVQG